MDDQSPLNYSYFQFKDLCLFPIDFNRNLEPDNQENHDPNVDTEHCTKNVPPLNFQMPHSVANSKRNICSVTAAHVDAQIQEASLQDTRKPDAKNAVETSAYIDSQLKKHKKISTRQMEVIDTVRTYLQAFGPHYNRNEQPPPPIRLLVTGMPGTGKSFVVERVCDIANWLDSGHVATMAFNGIAAVNIDGGTLCSLLSIPIPNGKDDHAPLPPLSTTKRNEISRTLLIDQLSLIIIDEISNVNAATMHAISKRFQQLTDNHDTPFGGFAVLCFGDFSQLPPVKSTSITHTLMMVSDLDQRQPIPRPSTRTCRVY